MGQDQVVGTVLAGYDGVRGWVQKVAAHPDCRRRGVATLLTRVIRSKTG